VDSNQPKTGNGALTMSQQKGKYMFYNYRKFFSSLFTDSTKKAEPKITKSSVDEPTSYVLISKSRGEYLINKYQSLISQFSNKKLILEFNKIRERNGVPHLGNLEGLYLKAMHYEFLKRFNKSPFYFDDNYKIYMSNYIVYFNEEKHVKKNMKTNANITFNNINKKYPIKYLSLNKNYLEIQSNFPNRLLIEKSHKYLQTQFNVSEAKDYFILSFNYDKELISIKKYSATNNNQLMSYFIPEPYVLFWNDTTELNLDEIYKMTYEKN